MIPRRGTRKSSINFGKIFGIVRSGTGSAAKSTKAYTTKLMRNPRALVFLTYLSSFVLVAMVVGLFLVLAVFAYFSRSLPNPNRLLERNFELSTRFFDKNGKLLYELYGDKNRTLINISDISPDVTHATLATEDSDFYLHQGFSLRGMARAVKNMVVGGSLQSGSTLTQQVIKNTLLSQEQTLSRKIKEFILSLQLENKYSKAQILQMYLNETPYGGQSYGILSAARMYFNKLPKDLTLAESAYLAGLPQRPTYYSNFGATPEAGIERKNYVLYLMKNYGWADADGKRHYITEDEYNAARAESLSFQQGEVPFVAPHFVFYVKQLLTDMFGEDTVAQGGLQVTTTLDLDVQQMAEKIVQEEVDKAKPLNVWNGAMVVLDPKTAGILAMVGSKGYGLKPEPEGCVSGGTGPDSCKFDPYVNVTISPRQPGSAIKPVTYATLLSQGYSAASPFIDVPTSFPSDSVDKPYAPVNYDGKFRGVMSLRKSLGNSLNIPAVKALGIAGLNNMIDMAEKMGITTFKDRTRYGLSLTLGGGETKLLELTNAYSVFSAGGVFRKVNPIAEVKDAKGATIYKWQDTGGLQVLDKGIAFIISDILSDDGARSEAFGFNSLLNIAGHQVAAKTGTTNDKRDNYAMGFTPSIVAGVWVGNSNNETMNPAVSSGITGATPIWNRFMTEYLKNKPNEKFTVPDNVKKITVDKLTGMLPVDGRDTREEWFFKGTEPTATSDWYEKIEVCKIDGLIANEGCKDAGESKVSSFVNITAEKPEWQDAVDAWIKENYGSDKQYFPPQMVSKLEFDGGDVQNKNDVNVGIVNLSDGDKVYLNFRLKVEVSAYNDIKSVNFYMDGDKKGDDKKSPFGYTFSLGKDDIGTHTFEVTATDSDGNKGSKSIRLDVVGYNQ